MSTDLQVADFDAAKLDLIKRTVAKGATQDEFELFLHACKRTGLDPLMKQIHAIKRWNAVEQRETMAIQTGIDGYRLVADRTGKYAGSDDPIFEEKDGRPVKATVTVWKMVEGQRVPFTASARWEEYAQKKKDGSVTSFWQRMPYGQLGKCAESLALRKAFPAELSGVYTHEEMQQADVLPVKPVVLAIPQVRPRVGDRDFGNEPDKRQADGGLPVQAGTLPQQAPDAPAAPTVSQPTGEIIDPPAMTDEEWTQAVTTIDSNEQWSALKADYKLQTKVTDLRKVKADKRMEWLAGFILYASKQGVQVVV